MTSKKISEFTPETKVRNDDIVLITTGLRTGETPATKIATKQQLNISEGAGIVFDAIVSEGPAHYWPLNAPYLDPLDEITKTQSIGYALEAAPFGNYIAKGAQRPTISGAVNRYIDTGITIEEKTAFTFIITFRFPNTAQKVYAGCINSSNNSGWDIGTGFPSATATFVRIFSAGVSVLISSTSFPINQTHVLAWTFDTINGHKLYKNGAEVATSNDVRVITTVAGNFCIHRQRDASGTGGLYHDGQVQDFAYFDTVLAQPTIENISNLILG